MRAVLGYLPQDFGVYPRVSAQHLLEHLAVLKGITGRGERRELVETLLQQVNLWDVRKSYRYEQGYTFELNLTGVSDELRDEFVAKPKPGS